MASQTICGACQKASRFELAEASTGDTNVRNVCVRCADCGAAIAVLDFRSVTELWEQLQQIKTHLGIR
jgi:hypothetical protein